jgi:L-serine/L-threonine ammonia-lyase
VVEPACGASLAVVYDNAAELAAFRSLLVVVCGGAGTSVARLQELSNACS